MNMKKILFIARRDQSPYAVEQLLVFTEETAREVNEIRVIKVNVPHYSQIYGGLLQVAEKIDSGEFEASAEARQFIQTAIKALDNNCTSAPRRELVEFVAKKTLNPWLRPSFCIYADGE